MAAKRQTVRSLADEASMDYDLALVTLWDAGFESIEDIDDEIPKRSLSDFQQTLGVTSARKMQSISFWEKEWNLSAAETRARLEDYGINVAHNARNLPKGAIRRLRSTQKITISSPPTVEVREEQVKQPPFSWDQIGRPCEPSLLSASEIIEIHEALVRDFASTPDPIDPPGVKDMNLLESAVFRAATELAGQRKYSSSELAASALLHSVIHNHAFHNGNKRTALVSAIVMLDRNDILLTCTEADLFRFVLRVSQHRIVNRDWSPLADLEVQEIARWLLRNSRAIQHGDRPLKWRELRKLLSNYNCDVSNPMPGNRVRVERIVFQKKFLGLNREKVLSATVGYRSDGHEVDQTLLKHLRKELWLDEDHGVDSAYFYGSDNREPDEFISQYRILLKRLAKL